MRDDRIVNNLAGLWLVMLMINKVWQRLEIKFYGEIQHRIVDDVIAVFFAAAIILAYIKGRMDR